jgi:hypothetical protein
MTNAEARHTLDRRQSDLLVDVVFGHMAFSSAKDQTAREKAHDWPKEAVRKLNAFLAVDSQQAQAGNG